MNVVQGNDNFAGRPMAACVVGATAVLLLAAAAGRADAQSYGPFGRRRSQEIRQSADDILSSQEFRHFPRLGREGDGGSLPFDPPEPERRSLDEGSSRAESGDERSSGDRRGDENGGAETRTDDSISDGASAPVFSVFSGAVGALYQLIAWTVVAGVVAFILYLIFMAVRNYESPAKLDEANQTDDTQGEAEPERPPGELPSDVYLKRARELAGGGRYLEAVAQLLMGAMSRIERAGLIRYRRGLTHRDYVRAARENTDMHAALREMVRVYEPLGFGRRAASREHFETMLSRYETAFHEPHPTAEN